MKNDATPNAYPASLVVAAGDFVNEGVGLVRTLGAVLSKAQSDHLDAAARAGGLASATVQWCIDGSVTLRVSMNMPDGSEIEALLLKYPADAAIGR